VVREAFKAHLRLGDGMMLKGCCCQSMDTDVWQDKECFWDQPRYFYRVTTRLALHSPITYSEDIATAMLEAKTKGYIAKRDPLILLKSGLFRGEIFLEVNPPDDPADCRELSDNTSYRKLQGAFYTVITKAPPFQMGTVVDKLVRDLKKKGRKVRDLYLCLANCPTCSKEKGNRTVIFAHLEPLTEVRD
jgi:hypothetical protein